MKSKPLLAAVLILSALVGLIAVVWYNSSDANRKPQPPVPDDTTVAPEPDQQLKINADRLLATLQTADEVKTPAATEDYHQTIEELSQELVDGGKRSLPLVEPMLDDSQQDVRMCGIQILSQMKQPFTVDLLARVATNAETTAERSAALLALAQIRPDKTMDQGTLAQKTQEARRAALADENAAIRKLGQVLDKRVASE